MHHADLISDLALERQRDRLAAAAAHTLAVPTPVRARMAQTLRRAADRIDAATSSPPPPVRSALPGGGC